MSRSALGVSALLLLALALRSHDIARHGLWCDEYYSLSAAVGNSVLERSLAQEVFRAHDFWKRNSVDHVLEANIVNDNGNAVLYVTLLHHWVGLFGTSDASIRAPSAIASLLAVVVLFEMTHRLFGARAAFAAALVLALHPMMIRYGQEARPYALATLLTLASTRAFLFGCLLARPAVRLSGPWVYGGLISASLLSHYLSAPIFALHGAFALFGPDARHRWRYLAKAWAMTGALVGLWLLVGGAEGFNRMTRHNAWLLELSEQPTQAWAYPTTLRNLTHRSLVALHALCGSEIGRTAVRYRWLPVLLAPFLFLLARGCLGAWRRGERLPVCVIVGLAGACIATGLAAALIAGHTLPLTPSYGIFSVPYAAVLLALGATSGPGRFLLRAASGVLWLTAASASLGLVYDDAPRFRRGNSYAQNARLVTAVSRPDDVLVFDRWAAACMTNLYLPRSFPNRQTIDANRAGQGVALWREDRVLLSLEAPPDESH